MKTSLLFEAILNTLSGTEGALAAEGAGEERTPGGRAVAAARRQVLAGAGAKCVARAEGEAGQGVQENELGASAKDCELPNSMHCLLTLEGPATALLDDKSIHDDKHELDKSGAMPQKPLMLPEFVHTP